MTTFEFIHGDLPGGRHEIQLPSSTSVTTIAGLYRDLTGADVSAAQLALSLRVTHVTATSESSSAMDVLLGVANRRIEVSLLPSQRPAGPGASRGAAVQLSGVVRPREEAAVITIKLYEVENDITVSVRVDKRARFSAIKAVHANRRPSPPGAWRFTRHGVRIADSDTPNGLGLVDGDVVELLTEQRGD
jgi:hypothetical protein